MGAWEEGVGRKRIKKRRSTSRCVGCEVEGDFKILPEIFHGCVGGEVKILSGMFHGWEAEVEVPNLDMDYSWAGGG